ncbi:unnamed protein product [Linum trigynum]|uniref:Gag-pol polyprotein n=1 Tax=Linum trigynum TaxID=586398 RepID=A0AAV2GFV0_9ROSI
MSNTRSGSSIGNPVQCTYCKKQGHTEDKCFQKNGYPPRNGGYKGKASANATSAAPDQEEIKISRADYEKLMILMRDKDTGGKPQQNPTPSFSGATWIQQNPGTYTLSAQNQSPRHAWILDTGASDHIVCSLNYLVNPRQVSNIPITLPTVDHVQATHTGTVTCVADAVVVLDVRSGRHM